jgi:putative transposase
MNKLDLSKGSEFTYLGNQYEVKEQVDMDYLLAKNMSTHKKELLKITDILENIGTNNKERIEEIDDRDWEMAKERLAIIRPIMENGYGKREIQEIAQKEGLHYTTIYRWLNAYKLDKTLHSLVPNTKARGPRGMVRISEEADLITKMAIESLYLGKQKYTARQVYQEIVKRCRNAKVTPPHENTVRRRIAKLSEEHVIAKRESRSVADRKYRNTDGVFPEGTYPLDVVQVDHTPMDIIVVDEKERKPIGKPFLTMAIDVYSRMVTGFYIALEPPSYFSVSQCLSQSIRTKERFLHQVGVNGDWKLWGVPGKLHLDNGADFRSKSLQRFCELYDITIMWRPVARPQFGGHIERLIGTSMKQVHTLPGTTFSNIRERGEYDSNKEAAMTLGELEQWVTEFIVNVYHRRCHNSLGMSPVQKFEEGVFGSDKQPGTGLPSVIADEKRLYYDLLPAVERTVQQHGVVIDNVRYYESVLRRWIKAVDPVTKKPRKFVFKRDLRDISMIYFYDPEIRDYFPIPYRSMGHPAMTYWELCEATRKARDETKHNSVDENEIFDAFERMEKIRNSAVDATKKARRKASSRQTLEKRKRHEDGPVEKEQTDAFDELFSNAKPFDDIEA